MHPKTNELAYFEEIDAFLFLHNLYYLLRNFDTNHLKRDKEAGQGCSNLLPDWSVDSIRNLCQADTSYERWNRLIHLLHIGARCALKLVQGVHSSRIIA